jgi:long-chain acyl-CoA synthetase
MANEGARGADLAYEPRLLTEMFEAAASRFPRRPAIDFMGRVTRYDELAELVERATAGLQALGVSPGDRVALCLPNLPHYPVLFLATLKAGGVVVNVNPLYVERELHHLLKDSGAKVIATCDLPDIHARVSKAATELNLARIVTCPIAEALPPLKAAAYRLLKRNEIARIPADDPRHVPFSRLIAHGKPPKPVAARPQDVVVLQYTGGTTGLPKAAMLSHANLGSNAEAMVVHAGGERPDQDRILGVIPLFHVFALLTVFLFAIRVGGEMILLPRFDLKQTLKALVRKRPTYFPAVPTIYGAVAAAAESHKVDLSGIRACISGGAPLPAEIRHGFERATGGRLVEGYGLSEASPIITCNPLDGSGKEGSAGAPFPGTTIEIRDPVDPERLLPRGEIGEICARGPQVMAGYWNKPEETAAVFAAGALRTGDLGYLDGDGYLFIVDRIKDLIICSGYNVYPRVIEEALYEHPAVAEAIVIGVPDPYRGQAPKAFVALAPGQVATPEELRDFLRDKVSKIELPREVEIRDKLPRTLIGKLSKKELVEEEKAKAASSQSGAEGR